MDSTYKPKYDLIKQKLNNLMKADSQYNEELLSYRKATRKLKSEINSSDLFYDSELDQINPSDGPGSFTEPNAQSSALEPGRYHNDYSDSSGDLILPIVVGKGNDEVTILNIGRIIYDREAYHTQRYIWPVGFISQKVYASMNVSGKKCLYTNEIIENGNTPIFQVTNDEEPDKKYVSSSASGVWKIVLDKIAEKGFASKSHASGPQMMGLNNLGVVKYIQEMPGAAHCNKYVMQKWIEEPKERLNVQLPPVNNTVLFPCINAVNEQRASTQDFGPNFNAQNSVKRFKPNANSPLSNILNDTEYDVMSPHDSLPTEDRNNSQ